MAVFCAQSRQGFVQKRSEFRPMVFRVIDRIGQLHLSSLLFAGLAARLDFARVQRSVAHGPKQPARQHRLAPKRRGFARENREDSLGNILGHRMVTGLAKGG